MKLSPRKLQRILLRATLVGALLGVGWVFWRFETVRLPADACSPLLRFKPGTLLLVDRRPVRLGPGDAVLFDAPDGRFLIAVVTALEGGGLRVESDNADCPTGDLSRLGVVPRSSVAARVLMAFPF